MCLSVRELHVTLPALVERLETLRLQADQPDDAATRAWKMCS